MWSDRKKRDVLHSDKPTFKILSWGDECNMSASDKGIVGTKSWKHFTITTFLKCAAVSRFFKRPCIFQKLIIVSTSLCFIQVYMKLNVEYKHDPDQSVMFYIQTGFFQLFKSLDIVILLTHFLRALQIYTLKFKLRADSLWWDEYAQITAIMKYHWLLSKWDLVIARQSILCSWIYTKFIKKLLFNISTFLLAYSKAASKE